ncbi:protein phosphatase 2C domain-containing protein [Streptosporangium sp. NPDC050855]|uniref:protein phosphatase 2C domain-containing protein n=1 Tax=Streptosporangium sp. NPDC050855 TaxID=3366194 RepID=UPI00379BECA0
MIIAFETLGGSAERPNEDWVVAGPATVIVLDGVTAPRVVTPGCHHSVTWFTQNLGGRLLMLLAEDNDMGKALGDAIDQVADLHRDTCDLASPGIPAAAVAMLRKVGNDLEWLVLADTAIVLDTDDGLRVTSDNRVEQAAPDALARTRQEAIGTPEHQAAVARMSVEQLKKRNVSGGYWVAAADREAADNALTGRVPATQVRRVAIFTDGASRAVDTFGEMDWATCLDYLQEHGPRGLIQHVRRIEDGDPEGLKWPRFKKSDDATVAVIEI